MTSDSTIEPGTLVSVPNRTDVGRVVVFGDQYVLLRPLRLPKSLRHQTFYTVYFEGSGDVVPYHYSVVQPVPDPEG